MINNTNRLWQINHSVQCQPMKKCQFSFSFESEKKFGPKIKSINWIGRQEKNLFRSLLKSVETIFRFSFTSMFIFQKAFMLWAINKIRLVGREISWNAMEMFPFYRFVDCLFSRCFGANFKFVLQVNKIPTIHLLLDYLISNLIFFFDEKTNNRFIGFFWLFHCYFVSTTWHYWWYQTLAITIIS